MPAAFTVYCDEPVSPTVVRSKATVPALQPVVDAVIAGANVDNKENYNPLTGERTANGTGLKKRKTSILSTKSVSADNETPKTLEPQPKKRKASISSASSSTTRTKSSKKDVLKSKKPSSKRGGRRASPLPAVAEEAAEGSKTVANSPSQAAIDSRCYELTVTPLADISEAHRTVSPLEFLAESPLASENKSVFVRVRCAVLLFYFHVSPVSRTRLLNHNSATTSLRPRNLPHVAALAFLFLAAALKNRKRSVLPSDKRSTRRSPFRRLRHHQASSSVPSALQAISNSISPTSAARSITRVLFCFVYHLKISFWHASITSMYIITSERCPDIIRLSSIILHLHFLIVSISSVLFSVVYIFIIPTHPCLYLSSRLLYLRISSHTHLSYMDSFVMHPYLSIYGVLLHSSFYSSCHVCRTSNAGGNGAHSRIGDVKSGFNHMPAHPS